MIKITITKEITRKWAQRENVVTKETPTEILEDAYSGGRKQVTNIKEYAVVEVEKSATTRVTLIEQEIENEEKFDLAAVIKAINGL